MSAPAVTYAEQAASREAIHAHLVRCDANHRPRLSSRVDLGEYADKIFAHAATFEAWSGGELVGLVAAYLDDASARGGYITNVSVERGFMGRGIAGTLMRTCLAASASRGIRGVALEVSKANVETIAFYRKLGFEPTGDKGESLLMKISS